MIYIVVSCEREYHSFIVDCDFCELEKPEYGELVISLTHLSVYPNVLVTIFKGNIEDNKIVEVIDSVNTDKLYVLVKLDEYYSVTAEYTSAEKKITVLDGDKINTKTIYDECGDKCYMIKGGYIDVTLKYK